MMSPFGVWIIALKPLDLHYDCPHPVFYGGWSVHTGDFSLHKKDKKVELRRTRIATNDFVLPDS